jgi:predicted TIM-barrel fold metal-dependent hydrolase
MLDFFPRPTRRQCFASLAAAATLKSSDEFGVPFERIDTHTHIHRISPPLLEGLAKDGVRCLSICVSREIGTEPSALAEMIRGTIEVHRNSGGRIAWATAFDGRGFESPSFAEEATAGLRHSFDQGAIAVKIWKNIGMGIRGKSGAYLLPDDPALSPVFEFISKSGKTLIAHIAEPDGAWQPLDEHNAEVSYYSKHPEWHMHGRAGVPPKEAILKARDHVLRRHPKLRVIGCHLGSDEEHWGRLAKRLDAYPNFAVDLAARVRYFVRGDHEEARQFLTKYQDRILYGTDFTLPSAEDAQAEAQLHKTHEWDWKFLSTGEQLTFRNEPVRGLGLPEGVLRKIFRENAIRWLRGIAS